MTEYPKPNFGPGATEEAVELPPGGYTFLEAKSATDQFDETITIVTQARGAVYGHPLDDFDKVAKINEVVRQCPDPHIRHVLYMIGVKLARLVETPDHLDSLIDIAGYARTACMVIDKKGASDDET